MHFSSLPPREIPGTAADLTFLEDSAWLIDSVVLPFVFCRQGQWHVWLVFAWHRDPLRLLCRKGGICRSEAQARQQARLLTRGAGRDARGTLKLNADVYRFCES